MNDFICVVVGLVAIGLVLAAALWFIAGINVFALIQAAL